MANWTSDLEQEFELEFGDVAAPDRIGELDDAELEFESEGPEDEAADDQEFEFEDEFESGASPASSDELVERFMEVASRSYESEAEMSESVDRLLREAVEPEFFWKTFKKIAKKGLRSGVGRLMKTAKGLAANHPLFKSLQGLTSIHRNGLRGMLGQLATAASSVTPYGAAINGAMKALNFQPGAQSQEREAWENYVEVARESYVNLAENFSETQSLAGANEQAAKALATAMGKRRGRGGGQGQERRVIRLRPGQKVTIVCER
jgi:hypothetical protein